MRAIAEFAMRGRTQAVAVAAISAAIPLLFWMSAAVIALTSLRKGWEQGLILLLWSCLPAALWWLMQGDPSPVLVIFGTYILAVVLRTSMSWMFVLAVGCLIGIIVTGVVPSLLPELMAGAVEIGKQQLGEMTTEMAQASGHSVEDWLQALFAGVIGAIHTVVIIVSLILARWWQSSLYNPGGFKAEFQQLRLPKKAAIPLMLMAFFGSGIHPLILGWMPVLLVPFLIAAIALVHGLVAIKSLSGNWLVVFYLAMFFAGPWMFLLLNMLAFVDSMVDFRARVKAQQNDGDT